MASYRASRISISIPVVSPDGRYWGRYPQGNKPPLTADAGVGISVTDALTTGILLQGGAVGSTSATGKL